MEQVILKEPGKIAIEDVPVPEPGDGEVLLRVRAALTCGTDLKAFVRGHPLIPMPGPFGHEYSGTVAKAGRGVDGFKEGDHVMGVHSAPCLDCRYCRRGFHHLCEAIMDSKVLGSYAQYLLLPGHVVKQNIFHKPAQISFEEAALLEPFSCVVHPYRTIELDEIESAIVIGAGPIGLMHLAYLKTKGINVTVSDYFDQRLLTAENMGADSIISASESDKALKDAAGSNGVDLVVECTGQLTAWEQAVNYVRRGGTVLFFGGCPSGTTASFDAHRLHYDELKLLGSFHYSPRDVKNAYHILADRAVDLSTLISGEFPLHEIEKAFNLLVEGKGIKYALKP